MNKEWTDLWNQRYSAEDYAYGKTPNNFLKENLLKLNQGTILFPADGEGRNSVFAAMQGWNVSAFDISINGKNKALQLATENNVQIDYQVGELNSMNYQPEQFDVIALIYAHFPAQIRSMIHKAVIKYLKKEGIVIFEAFSKNHIHYNSKNEKVGGPRDVEMLFSIDELRSDFESCEIIELREEEVELSEGLYHIGKGSVIRYLGRKK